MFLNGQEVLIFKALGRKVRKDKEDGTLTVIIWRICLFFFCEINDPFLYEVEP